MVQFCRWQFILFDDVCLPRVADRQTSCVVALYTRDANSRNILGFRKECQKS